MAVFRVNKNTNYTCMSNVHLRDSALSLRARGLMSLILSLPDNWNYSKHGLLKLINESEFILDNTLDELKDRGYLVIEKHKPKSGSNRYSYIYNIYEVPRQDPNFQGVEIQGVENQGLENQGVENYPLNKVLKESITDKRNTEGVSTKTHKAQSAVDVLIDSYTEDAELKEALREYRESRKALKKPLTEGALKRCLSTLDKLAGSTSEKIAIVNQSIERGWVGLFQIDKRGGNYGRGNAQYRGVVDGGLRPVGAKDTIL